MKEDWNARAKRDAEYYIASGDGSGVASFRSSGELDARMFFEGLEHLLQPRALVVDIGCGIGRMDEFVAPKVGRLIGVDVSGEMVAKARARLAHLPNVEFREGDGWRLPLDPGSVDLIFSHIVFQHVPREVMEAYFHAAFGTLRPGGRFVFQVPEPLDVEAPDVPEDDTWSMRFYREARLRGILEPIGFNWEGADRSPVDTGYAKFNHLRVHVSKPV